MGRDSLDRERFDGALAARARGAYERGRLSAALGRSMWLTPVAAAALLCCRHPLAPVAAACGLVAAVTFLLWRGQEWRAGLMPGLMSGLPPLVIPFLSHAAGSGCSAAGCSIDPAPCLLAGVAGGLALGFVVPRRHRSLPGPAGYRFPFGVPLLSAAVVTLLAGSVGCGLYGLMGLAGLVAGLAAGAVPILAARHARA